MKFIFTFLNFKTGMIIIIKSGGSAFALNLYKCNLASIGFLIVGFIFNFTISEGIEVDDEEKSSLSWTFESVSYLILSGFIGIIIGDLAWLEALRLLGASRVLIIDTLKPFSAALFGWVILGESVHNAAFSGIILTVLGILVVGLERERYSSDQSASDDEEHQLSSDETEKGKSSEKRLERETLKLRSKSVTSSQSKLEKESAWEKRRGYAFAIGNIFLDTYGSVLTKQHGGRFTSWAINLIRFGSAGMIMVFVSILMRLLKKQDCTKKTEEKTDDGSQRKSAWYRLPNLDWKGWVKISLGVLFVTFLCPALSNYALFQIALALALTLGSITPLYALFLEWIFHGKHKKPTLRAIGGASLAIGGVVILGIFNGK